MRHRPTFTALTASILCFLFMALASPTHAELPKDVQKDQYMYSLMEALKAKDYQKALPYFKDLEDLKVPLSDSFYYFKGEALANTGKPLEAYDAINVYIKKTGKKGKYYKNAIAILAQVDAHVKAAEAREKAAQKEAQLIVKLKTNLSSLHVDEYMVNIPEGCFDMGSPGAVSKDPFTFTPIKLDEPNYDAEKPQHKVCLKSFRLAKHEVTQGLWKLVMGNNPSSNKAGDNYPVDMVSWVDAQAFIRILNAASGKHYRLPTEAEWEYACRAGSNHKYCGSDNIDAVAWYESNSGDHTHPVAQKQANAHGLYDMSGNVGEWLQDCMNHDYQGAPTDGAAWESGDCSLRITRGGLLFQKEQFLRSTRRGGYLPEGGTFAHGFRLAQD